MNVDEPGVRRASPASRPYEYVIVGGGVHGTCVANYLLDEGGYDHEELCLIDPHERLLGSFETKARKCGMRTLRSTFVHHIDTEPFSLDSFAEGAHREHELIPTEDYPNRPTLDLFLDHVRYVIDRRGIDDCHFQSAVTNIERPESQGPLRVETGRGTFRARRVVLAVGLGGQLTVPSWATSLPDGARLAHVWDDDFDPTTAAAFDGRTFVVGGGITAAQLACRLSEGADVTLLSRHDLEVELTEADSRWINWRHIEQEIHSLPPGSAARCDRIRAARHDATIPPYVERRLADARDCGALDVRHGEIECARASGDGLHLRFDDGTTETDAQVVLATGHDSAPKHPLVGALAESLSLERGANGFPVLDDRTLAWQRSDGADSALYVSGALAEMSVGPFARNVVGARRAAERLLDSRDGVDSKAAAPPSRGRS